ncbi:TetR/AcrR family transcriptional regulator [Magnetovibrio sp.]|uniref:TetR/AcrR family transcriptional regulator n=1 Tax=Magnetovibrio sp. TaxID=2024836 RepID=UPI002F929D8F
MARPQQFDTDTVLDKAMQVFWKKGFDDASVQDLVDATGLNRGSLYNAFGDKAQLFAAVMERYRAASPTKILSQPSADTSPRQQIVDFFYALVERAQSDVEHKGCLLTNTAAGLYGCNDAMSAWIHDTLTAFEDLLTAVIERGQHRGEITSAQSAREMARFFVAIAQGINVMARANPAPDVLRDIVSQALRTLD